ncbi:MAG: DUF3592 domain-containing protein [Candidatus Paceibacterota bacterium]|jgi:hypothetical protein
MKLFSNLKQQAVNFLEPYKTKGPATYAAAEQAIGAVLIADGFFGIENPFGAKKRPGIFGTFSGMILGIVFILVPGFFGEMTNIKNMTATVPAVVVSVGDRVRSSSSSGGSTCTLAVRYTVDSQEYIKQSSMSSSNYCSLSAGQSIVINYDPNNPDSWVYGEKTISTFLNVFFWAGVFVLISNIATFFIRLFSIIFGWKLLRDGRKNAATLPPGTNLGTIINEIKQNFVSSIFAFGGAQDTITSALTKNTPPPTTQKPTDQYPGSNMGV